MLASGHIFVKCRFRAHVREVLASGHIFVKCSLASGHIFVKCSLQGAFPWSARFRAHFREVLASGHISVKCSLQGVFSWSARFRAHFREVFVSGPILRCSPATDSQLSALWVFPCVEQLESFYLYPVVCSVLTLRLQRAHRCYIYNSHLYKQIPVVITIALLIGYQKATN